MTTLCCNYVAIIKSRHVAVLENVMSQLCRNCRSRSGVTSQLYTKSCRNYRRHCVTIIDDIVSQLYGMSQLKTTLCRKYRRHCVTILDERCYYSSAMQYTCKALSHIFKSVIHYGAYSMATHTHIDRWTDR